MTSRPLSLAILWHMHQPFYKDLVTGEYILPWVRLHAIKDYYDMVAILDKFPEVKMTFNVVPALLSQVQDYVENRGKVLDKFLRVTLIPPGDLSLEDKVFILENFFMANWENMINIYPRYHDLLLKRGRFVSRAELSKVAKRFSNQELLDLQVWFNLAWFGFIYKKEDPVVRELINKGKYFTEDDKQAVIDKQWELMGKVIGKYKELSDRGQIELTTTPFYHPILPLLCDTNAAREAMPYTKLPPIAFQHPEDAEEQIRMAVEFHEKNFGTKPAGMWPSEGSVSEQIIPLVAKNGIKWLATDEAILERTIHKIEQRGRTLSAADINQPYRVEKDGAGVAMIFRNHYISDQVGFVYYRWKVEDAIADFMNHLNNIRVSLPEDHRNYLASVILDGENAWEYYHGGGEEFLEAFYARLACDPSVRTVRVCDYLQENPPQRKLTKLFAGSWINNNFKIWIGHEEDNKAWEYLHEARLVLDKQDNPVAWQELYIAEGSDWCWWYGDDHSSGNDAAFDELFRKHLKNIYHLTDRISPKYLETPIKMGSFVRPIKEPVYLIHPRMDGEVSNYYEWLPAGHYDISRASGAMHQIETLLKEIYYGFSMQSLFLRLGFNAYPAREECASFSFAVITSLPHELKVEVSFDADKNCYICKLYKMGDLHTWSYVKEIDSFGVGRIIELGISFSDMMADPGQKIEFTVVVYKDDLELERWPRGGVITVTVPTDTYEEEQWFV